MESCVRVRSPKTRSQLISPSEADRRRRRDFIIISSLSLVSFTAIIILYQDSNYIATLGFAYIIIVAAAFIASILHLRFAIRKGRPQWQGVANKVSLSASQSLVFWEFGALSLTASSAIMAVVVQMLGTHGAWMVSVGLGIMGTIALYYLIPILRAGGPTSRRISLTRSGVEFTRIDGYTDEIPWKAHPALIGVRQANAVISLKNQEDLHYPMSYLPMSMRQLERLLATFSSNRKLRAKLSGPEALSTVLAVLEPTEEELTDGSWTWSR